MTQKNLQLAPGTLVNAQETDAKDRTYFFPGSLICTLVAAPVTCSMPHPLMSRSFEDARCTDQDFTDAVLHGGSCRRLTNNGDQGECHDALPAKGHALCDVSQISTDFETASCHDRAAHVQTRIETGLQAHGSQWL